MLVTNVYDTETALSYYKKKVDPAILEELLSKSRDQSIEDFIAVIDLKPKKKTLKELIKNAYKKTN